MKFRFTYLLLSLAIAGCHVGPQIEDFEQARRPEGITTIIELRGGIAEREHVEGELLEVRKDGLLLKTREARADGVVKRRLVFAPYTAMEDVGFEELNLSVVNEFDPWDEEDYGAKGDGPSKRRERDREKLRLLSRFPQGLSRPLLEELLAAEGQTTVEVIGGE